MFKKEISSSEQIREIPIFILIENCSHCLSSELYSTGDQVWGKKENIPDAYW